MCKKSANAAYGAVMLNADMVNLETWCLKLVEFCKKLLGKSEFLSFKTTVKYDVRFDLNSDIRRPFV